MRYLVLVVAVTLGTLGCPEPPVPPFDATGQYIGTWRGTTTDQAQTVAACLLTMVLEQDLTKPYPGSHGVQGTVTVDYSCLELPSWVEKPPPSEVEVGGILADDGNLVLATGGCGPGLCIVLLLAGQGVDSNGDGRLDTYTGDWAYTILLAGVQPFGVTGGFEVSVAVD